MSYSSTILADSPIRYYRLGETSGTIANDSGSQAQNGTINAGVTLKAAPVILYDSDMAMTFNGSSTSYISLPTTGLPSGSQPWTLEAWARFSSTPSSFTTVVGFGSNAGHLEQANLMAMSDLSVLLTAYFGDIQSPPGVMSLNAPNHLVGTYDGASTWLYVNGQLVAGPVPYALNVTLAWAYIGASNSPLTNFITGDIDEVAIYNTALSPTRIQAHYAAGYSASQYNLSRYKEQMILVYDQNNNFIDSVRDAPLLSGFKESINAVTSSLKVQLPRKFEQIDLPGQTNAHGIMQQGYIWKYYLFGPGLPSSGLLRYSGQVDEYAPQIAENGEETIAVTLTPQGSAIADSGLGATISFGTPGKSSTYVDPITQFNYWFNSNDPVTGQTYCYPLTLDPNNPSSSGVTTQFTYTNQTIKSILDNVILMLPTNYFYRTNPDNTVTLNQTPTTAQHVLQVGVHISNPQYSQSWIQTQTAVFFLGGPNPSTVTAAKPNGDPIIAIKRGVDMKSIGKRLFLHNESRVTDQGTANTLAQGDLDYYDQAMLRTKIRVPDYRGPNASIGYDIESIKVGDSIQIQDNTYNGAATTWDNAKWGSGIWDQSPGPALNTVGVITALSYGFHFIDIELGLPQPNLQRAVSQMQQKFQDYTLI
jgi:hypothetical protein